MKQGFHVFFANRVHIFLYKDRIVHVLGDIEKYRKRYVIKTLFLYTKQVREVYLYMTELVLYMFWLWLFNVLH